MNKISKFTSVLNNCTNLADIFIYYKRKFPKKHFLFKKEQNHWVGQSFEEVNHRVCKIISAFKSLGLKKSDRVFLLSSNRTEWVEFDLAIMSIGAICVPSFVTNNVEDNAFICKDSNPSIIILENENIFKNNQEFLKNFDKEKIIIIDKSALFLDYYQIISQKKKTIKTPVIK